MADANTVEPPGETADMDLTNVNNAADLKVAADVLLAVAEANQPKYPVMLPSACAINGVTEIDAAQLTPQQLTACIDKLFNFSSANRIGARDAQKRFNKAPTDELCAAINTLNHEYQLTNIALDNLQLVSKTSFLHAPPVEEASTDIAASNGLTATVMETSDEVAATPNRRAGKRPLEVQPNDNCDISDFKMPPKHLISKKKHANNSNHANVSNRNVNNMSSSKTVTNHKRATTNHANVISNANSNVSKSNPTVNIVQTTNTKVIASNTVNNVSKVAGGDPAVLNDGAGTSANNSDGQAMDAQASVPAGFRKNRVPAFHVVPPHNWHRMIQRFVPAVRSKLQGTYLKINVDSEDQHRQVQAFLIKEKVQFKSYLLDQDKQLKVVVRGLPINTRTEEIKSELTFHGFEGHSVSQLYKGPTTQKVYMPLFQVSLPKTQTDLERIFEITELMGTEVSVSRYTGKKGPSQCFNCQGFFHSASACRLAPACVKCAGPHSAKECPKPFDEPCKCKNCGADHPSNFRSCPKFPKLAKKGNKPRPAGRNQASNTKSRPPVTFSARKVDPTRSYAGATTGASATVNPSPPSPPPQIASVPSVDANSDTDLLKYSMILMQNFDKNIVLAGFKKALPALRTASSAVDRQYILLESVCTLQ